MSTVIYYLRFSSDKQRKGSSLERQQKLCDLYCDRSNLPAPTKIYRDKARSAFHGSHLDGDFGKLVKALEAEEYPSDTILICESLDRISRQEPRSSFNLVSRILEHASIVTTIDGQTYSNNDNTLNTMLIQLVKAATAYEESQKKSERAKEFWAKKRATGEAQNSIAPLWLNLNEDRKTYSVVPEHANSVLRAFELASEGIGLRSIVAKIDEESGQKYGMTTVRRWLTDKRTYGSSRIEAAISEELFNRVQRIRTKKPSHQRTTKTPSENLFQGLFKCGECNSSIVYLAPRPCHPTWSGHLYCRQRHQYKDRRCKTSKRLNYRKFEKIFLELLTDIESHLLKSKSSKLETAKEQWLAHQHEAEKLELRTQKMWTRIIQFDEDGIDTTAEEAEYRRLKAELAQAQTKSKELEVEVKGHSSQKLELPKAPEERKAFNMRLIEMLGTVKIDYPTTESNWFTFTCEDDSQIAISGDYKQYEIILEDDRKEIQLEEELLA